jgi:hypothetical protein
MTWKCPECGVDANEDAVSRCMACGHVRLALLVTLTSEATGKQIRMRIDTPVGKRMLSETAGEEGVFGSEVQFRVRRDEAMGGWVIQHEPSATNPTWLDGAALGREPRVLADGAVVSIGPAKCRLTVLLTF